MPDDGENVDGSGLPIQGAASTSSSVGGIDINGDATESPILGPHGPIAAPLQNFPSVDIGFLRRRSGSRVEGQSVAQPAGLSAVASAGRRRAESDPAPLRQSLRNDTRKRRIEEQGRRTTVEMSEEERLEKNRQSARDCRLRKKRYIEVSG